MIMPMKKVCLAVQNKHNKDALIKLREAGVLHIEISNADSDNLSRVKERKTKIEEALSLISPYKIEKEQRKDSEPGNGRRASDKMGDEAFEPYSLDAVNAPKRPDLVELMLDMRRELKELEEQQSILARECDRIAPWGEFNPQDIRELGLPLYFYQLSLDAFKTIQQNVHYDIRYITISENKASIQIMVLDKEIPGIPYFALPEKSLFEIEIELVGLHEKLEALHERIKSFADRRPSLFKEMAIAENDEKFEEALAEFKQIEGIPFETGISLICGFIPKENLDLLKARAAEHHWALVAADPGPDDLTPTKLKNNRFAEMVYPLTGFLDLVPGYNEVDVSGWFLLFVTVFFGMIFGDAAYGLLLFITAIICICKTAKTGVPVAFKLLLLLSISNVSWGVFTCSWFGVEIDKLPNFFRDISLAAFSTAKGTSQAIVNQNLQIFCFSLALLQMSIARIGGLIIGVRKKNLRLFAELGSLFMLWGMFNVVLFLVVSNEYRQFPLFPVSLFLLGGGFILCFLFTYYEGSIIGSILESLKNFISVILGVTGIFSDIMSYIRLWAVGLAGASLAVTINIMAGPLLGSFLIFLGTIILVFGHGLNLILNTLSVLVHGVRLNILEFSSHAGLTWSGIAYKPFTETSNK